MRLKHIIRDQIKILEKKYPDEMENIKFTEEDVKTYSERLKKIHHEENRKGYYRFSIREFERETIDWLIKNNRWDQLKTWLKVNGSYETENGFKRLSDKAIDRFIKAEKSNNISDLFNFNEEDQQLLFLSKFNGKTVRLTIKESEYERYGLAHLGMILIMENKRAGQFSTWKRIACEELYGEYNNTTRKQLNKYIFEKFNLYTSDELK